MSKQEFFAYSTRVMLFSGLLYSLPINASFIESTIGTAVVNDATATYYNPAALSLLKKSQIIALGPIGRSQNQFSGKAIDTATGFTQSGTTNTRLTYILPALYLGIPATDKIQLGLALVANDFNRDIDGYSILRYAQAGNTVQNLDVVPALGFKINDFISVGASVNHSRAHFLLRPIYGVPRLNIPDSQSRNESWGSGWGGDVGVLLRPFKGTVLGINYRSAITYALGGTSTYYGPPSFSSNSYRFDYWTPARTVVSINQFLSPKFGLVGTVQYIQWNIFKNLIVHDIAVPTGILPTASVPYNFHNGWLVTLGAVYRASPKWVLRAATSYTQAPSNGKFQIDIGDSVTLGASMGYTVLENVILDCSYAHVFITEQDINIASVRNTIVGSNKGSVDAIALKLTVFV